MDIDIDEDVSIKKYLRMLSEGLCMAGTYYSLLSADLYFTSCCDDWSLFLQSQRAHI